MNRPFKRALFVMGVVSLPASTLAAEPDSGKTEASVPTAEAPKPSTSEEHLRGLEFMLRPAIGSGGSNSPVRYEPTPIIQVANLGDLVNGSSTYGAGFVGQAFLGYRFHPIISAGLRGGFRTSSSSSLSDGSTDPSRTSWDAGFYVRAYPLALTESVRKYLDPWVSVGVEYMRDTQKFKRPVPTTGGASVQTDWDLDHHAVAVPIGVGVDYRVHPMISIGPSFEYAIASGVAGCLDITPPSPFASQSYCTDKDPGKQVLKAKTYGVWSVGLDLKVTLF